MTNQKKTSNKQKKFRFNVIDILIILILITVFTLIFYCLILGKNISDIGSTEKNIEYSLFIQKMDVNYKDAISFSDEVVDSETKKSLGKVKETSYSYSAEHIASDNGSIQNYIYQDKIDLIVTVSATANIKNGVLYINGVKIAVGEYVNARFPHFAPSEKLYCMDIATDY